MEDRLGCRRSGRGGRLFGCLQRDGVAERFELALESAGAVLGGVALALPVGAEFSEGDSVADDVVVGDEDVVAQRADRLGLATAPAQLREVGGEVGVLGAGGGLGALGERVGQPAWPGPGLT